MIRERDGRAPDSQLREVGGISACAAGDVARAMALAEAGWAAAHAVDKFGSSALMWAASYPYPYPLALTLTLALPLALPLPLPLPLTRWAASYGRVDAARWLVEKAGAAVDATNKAGRSALTLALPAPLILPLPLDPDPYPNPSPNPNPVKEGRSALMFGAKYGQVRASQP